MAITEIAAPASTPTPSAPAPSRLKRLSQSPVLLAGALVMTLVCVYLTYRERMPFQHLDLEVYRYGVDAWLHGKDPYHNLPATLGGHGLKLPFIYPPFALLTALPFDLLPWVTSYQLLFVLSEVCVFGALYVVGRQIVPNHGRKGALLVACAGTSTIWLIEPVRGTLDFGQINLLLLGLVVVDCLTPKARWPRGIGVGLAAAIKLTPAVFVLYFLLRKDYRAAAVSVVTTAVATGIGFAMTWTHSVQYWFHGMGESDIVSGSTYRANQTLMAVFHRLDVPNPWLKIVTGVCIVIVVALVVYGARHTTAPVSMLLCSMLAVLCAPTAWSHHWIWIIPAIPVLIAETIRRGHWLMYLATTVTILIVDIGPFNALPGNDDWRPQPVDLEKTWNFGQSLVGDSFVILGVGWVVAAAVAAYRRSVRTP